MHYFLLLHNKLSPNLMASNKKNILSLSVSVGQEIESILVEWFWLGAFLEVVVKMLEDGKWGCSHLRAWLRMENLLLRRFTSCLSCEAGACWEASVPPQTCFSLGCFIVFTKLQDEWFKREGRCQLSFLWLSLRSHITSLLWQPVH